MEGLIFEILRYFIIYCNTCRALRFMGWHEGSRLHCLAILRRDLSTKKTKHRNMTRKP